MIFLDFTPLDNTLGRTPLDEGFAQRRDLYLTTHNTLKRETSMSPAGSNPETEPKFFRDTFMS
jgi:hypothetical protein